MNSPDPGALPASAAEPPGVRQDAFYGGRFHLLQPVGRGYRSGLDALLLAATVGPDDAGALADLGAGSGAVGLAAACRCEGVAVTLVEKNAEMAELARRSVRLDENRPLAGRVTVLEGDILARRGLREAAGLFDGRFAHVLTNPPYHPHGSRPPPDPLRAEALFGTDAQSLARWLQVAAALVARGGGMTAVLRADALAMAITAVEGRLGGLRVLPIHPASDAPASRILFHGRKGSRAPLAILPGRVLHRADGGLDPFAERVAAGEEMIGFTL
ncbi:tRNA1(Val) (adenine(37)-N6)-methyltransferase [Jiella sp. M17.18]|uniref:tRNA1(Val) (adenine(37)-N6)-methyltransferase n=1 Tax=Jiella sp. M17.18 TaxID=3234247 RepID=UPI0034DFD971